MPKGRGYHRKHPKGETKPKASHYDRHNPHDSPGGHVRRKLAVRVTLDNNRRRMG